MSLLNNPPAAFAPYIDPSWTRPLPDKVLQEENVRLRVKLAEARALLTASLTVGISPGGHTDLISMALERLKENA